MPQKYIPYGAELVQGYEMSYDATTELIEIEPIQVVLMRRNDSVNVVLVGADLQCIIIKVHKDQIGSNLDLSGWRDGHH